MHLARCAWCRTYQTVFRIASPVLPYTEPRILEHAERAPARPLSALAVARPWTVPRAWEHESRSQTSPSTRCAACCASTVSCRCLFRFPLPSVREAKLRSRRLSPMTRRTTSTPLTTLCLSRALRCTTPSSRGLPASITGQTGMGALTHAVEAFIDWVDRMNAALDIPKYVTGIRRSDIPEMAAHADAEANPLYPVPLLMNRLELMRMYEVVAGGMFEGEN